MQQIKAKKRKTQSTRRTHRPTTRKPHPSPLNPHPLKPRTAADINRIPPFGSGPLLLEQTREQPLKTVCRLFDYGIDHSLIAVWEEWTELAITSREENVYSETRDRARLIQFGGYFTQLIAAWLQLYTRITPEALRPPQTLSKGIPVKRLLSAEQEPEAVIRRFTRLYTRRESQQELWSATDAIATNPAARQVIRQNLLSYYEAMACITEASFALFPSPESRMGKGL